jgi:hypothetical protein
MLSNLFIPSSAEIIMVSFPKSNSEASSPSDESSRVLFQGQSLPVLLRVFLMRHPAEVLLMGRPAGVLVMGRSARVLVMRRFAGILVMKRLRWGTGRPAMMQVPRRG